MSDANLRQLITDNFSESDLRAVCYDLGINYDEQLQGPLKSDKVVSLLTYCQRRNCNDKLIEICSHSRQDLPWPGQPQNESPKIEPDPLQLSESKLLEGEIVTPSLPTIAMNEQPESRNSSQLLFPLINNIFWIITGVVFLGGILDAIINSLALISPTITYVGTGLVLFSLLAVHLYIQRNPQIFVDSSGQTISLSGLPAKVIFQGIGVVLLLWFPRLLPPAQPDLFILSPGDRLNSFLVGGADIGTFSVGDRLVVYETAIRDAERPIGLLHITAKQPNNLETQALLIHPDYPIRPNLRLDDQIEALSTAQMVPANEQAVGYVLAEELLIFLRPNSGVQVGTKLEALELTWAGNTIVDYLPFQESVLMEVESVGIENSSARVTLTWGSWPEPGTILVFANGVTTETIDNPGADTIQCRIIRFEHLPESPVSKGTDVALSGEGECNKGVRAVRFMIDGESKSETSLPHQTHFWRTNEYLLGTHTICFEVAGGADSSWENAASECVVYELLE